MTRSGSEKAPPEAVRAVRPSGPGAFYAWPMGLWFTLFFIVPLVIIISYSFMEKGLYGGVEFRFSLEGYRQMFSPAYGLVFLRTVKTAAVSTIIIILLALPCGYAMARSRYQTLFLFLVIIPFWTNSLIRIFAWMSILSNEGSVSTFFRQIGLTDGSVSLLYNQGAVVLVSVYMYLPYAILPVFTAIDRFDFSLLEAARDLGAPKSVSICKVMLPNIKSGIVTAVIFTFIPIFGAYTVPLLVGGKDSYMLGNIIVDQVTKTRNWPLAAAFSLVITLVSTAGVMWMVMAGKKSAAAGYPARRGAVR